jgi:tRNA/tmRNA/rRNA uracil-C5-methylase (TrmA/RlmC/RlmD family)
MKKNDILSSIRVEKLVYGGSGMATLPDGMKIMISGGAIPESIVDLRILRVKKRYCEAQILRVVTHSPFEQEIPSHWQIYGGCKWLAIPYEKQLEIKE